MNNDQPVFFIIPPFTQLNTAYPATAFLKGFLNTLSISSEQMDLGLETLLSLFTRKGLTRLFSSADPLRIRGNANFQRMVALQEEYLNTIEEVIAFLQDRDPSIAHLICSREWLPEASRFEQTADLEMAFGELGIRDKARHLATLYLEDLADLITGTTDPNFGFSRYAEQLGRSPATFDELEAALVKPDGFIDQLMLELLAERVEKAVPRLIALTVPFPGNLYAALKCGQWIKKNHPGLPVVLGGGYAGTELRSVRDSRLFDFIDFLILDDGELPLLRLLEYLDGKREMEGLKRTFLRKEGNVVYCNGDSTPDFLPGETGTPDYQGLKPERYLPVIALTNPMHRLWSDGRWNRLLLAHGCYWAKCTFCDTSLDYIRRYHPDKPGMVVDRMEIVMKQTRGNGFHFVDEAAPPALLREVALEILRRGLNVSWWTNIRFEKHFTRDLCRLLKASGCIAVSGGLEVASDRILKLINKGVTVADATRVARNFAEAGILVHTYLMYGFPTQTAQETIDALEVVRQLFDHGLVQSGYWHLFTMTAHSPIGLHPEQFGAIREANETAPFANNDLVHHDLSGCDHQAFGEGLRKALYNYMHGLCFDYPLQEWFAFDVPVTKVSPLFVERLLQEPFPEKEHPSTRVYWLGGPCELHGYQRKKKGKIQSCTLLLLHNKKQEISLPVEERLGHWLNNRLPMLSVRNRENFTLEALKQDYEGVLQQDFKRFLKSQIMRSLCQHGLILL